MEGDNSTGDTLSRRFIPETAKMEIACSPSREQIKRINNVSQNVKTFSSDSSSLGEDNPSACTEDSGESSAEEEASRNRARSSAVGHLENTEAVTQRVDAEVASNGRGTADRDSQSVGQELPRVRIEVSEFAVTTVSDPGSRSGPFQNPVASDNGNAKGCVVSETLGSEIEVATCDIEPSSCKSGSMKQKKISDMFPRQVGQCHKNSQGGIRHGTKRMRFDSSSESSELLNPKHYEPNSSYNAPKSLKLSKMVKKRDIPTKRHSHCVPGTPNKNKNAGNQQEGDEQNDCRDAGIIKLPAGMKELKIVLKDLCKQTTALSVLERFRKDLTVYICETCDKPLRSFTQWQQHSRVHSGEKPYKCRSCKSCFGQLSQLQRHERLHTKERPFACKCGRAFNTKYHMERHARTHERKVYECNLCDRTFWYEYALDTHIRVHHNNEKKHQCSECDMRFKYPCQLKNHFRSIHTDEKPYSCDQCDRKFASKGQVRLHKLVHTDIKPYKCKECGQFFRHLLTLRNHLRTHTGERPFCCRYCARSFSQQGNMALHEKICKDLNSTDPL